MKNIWGLSIEIIDELGNDLLSFYDQFKQFFKTKTRDVSHHGLTWFKGSLLMEGKRTYMEVSRKMIDPLDDGQNLQHFMSDSPWKGRPIFDEIQGQIRAQFPSRGSILNIDESGDECSSTGKASTRTVYSGKFGYWTAILLYLLVRLNKFLFRKPLEHWEQCNRSRKNCQDENRRHHSGCFVKRYRQQGTNK